MKMIITTVAAALIAVSSFAGNGIGDTEPTSVSINVTKSQVYWTGKKVTGLHTGGISLQSGSIVLDGDVPTKVSAVIDMNSITCSDLTDAGTNAKLVGHLKSPDFFHVDEHPTGVFETTRITPIEGAQNRDANYTLTGNLTLKGITHEIEFPALIAVNQGHVVANGQATIDRSKWEIKFGSSSFFEGLGDNLIYNDIQLNLVVTTK